MNKKQLYDFGMLYHPYSKNPQWVKWFVKVAPLKIERSIQILRAYKGKQAKVLDYGCGIGFNVYYLSKFFSQVVGVDIDKPSIEIAKKQLKKLRCNNKVLHYDGKKLPFKNNIFDVITANDVWEHAEKPRVMMKEIYRVLKPDGILLINTPNKWWPIETHYKLPFLSYLPTSLANLYVRLSNITNRYDDIHLPTYDEFKKSVGEFFTYQNITFDLVRDYKKNKLADERGAIIPLVGDFLNLIKPLERVPVLSFFYSLFLALLDRTSVGWFFVAWPKKKK